MKKVLLGLGAAGITLAMIPLFAAFEAHVVNVTARIENALSVSTKSIDFGTVFPQEHLEKPLTVELSGSFLTEGRVDDVTYFIRQKPKCGVTTENGQVLLGPTATGHILPNNQTPNNPDDYVIDCGTDPRPVGTDNANEAEFGQPLPLGSTWGVLPSLCEYISKNGSDPDGTVTQNDESLSSFHTPWTFSNGIVSWTDTAGHLTKLGQDTVDNWIIDLAVPCFGGYCAQDWLKFVRGESGNLEMTQDQANAFTQPIGNEHKVFGCDLWVEVDGVSLTPRT